MHPTRSIARATVAGAVALLVTAVVLPVAGAGSAPSGSISGRVLGGDLDPVEGICVDATGGAHAVTDAGGHYTLAGLEAGSDTVSYTDCRAVPEFLPAWYLDRADKHDADPVTVVDGSDTALQDMTLVPGIAVSGTVTDAAAQPVAGVSVNVNPTTSGPSVGTQTAADGTFTTGILSPGSYTVQFSPSDPSFVTQYWKDQASYGAADPLVLAPSDAPVRNGIDAHLALGASVQGTVTGAGGAPLSGVCVDANVSNGSGWNGVGNTQTAADGTYSLTSLPAADVRVRFQACGAGAYVEQWYSDAPDFNGATPVGLTAGNVVTHVDAQLHAGAQVAGTVTDGAGTPIPNVSVNVNPAGSGPSAWAQTDADGRYLTSAVPAGRYRVEFQDTGAFAGQFWNDQPSWNNATLLDLPTGGGIVGGIDASLEPAASISGTVTGPALQPVGNLCVFANVHAGDGLDWVGGTTTAADGTYTLSGLPPAGILVQFQDCNAVGPYITEWWNDHTDPADADVITLGPGAVRTAIDAQLGAAGAITGTVTDGAGHPLQGICAQATTSTFAGGIAGTDDHGQYTILLSRPGGYRVQFVDCNQPPRYAGQWWNGRSAATAEVVPVGPGQVVGGIDAVLRPGVPGTISGRVVTARGTGIAGTCVIAYLPTQFAVIGAVQDDGSYVIPDVPSGTYALAFLGCDGGEPTAIVADPAVPGVTYAAAWWDGVPVDITGTGGGGPDPIAQGATLVTVDPGADLTGYDHCFGCGTIPVVAATPAADRVTVAFDVPDLSPGVSAQLRAAATGAAVEALTPHYVVSCTANGDGAARSASGSASPLTVTGLVADSTYRCGVAATVDGAVVATSASFAVTIPRPAAGEASDGTGSDAVAGLAFSGADLTRPAAGVGRALGDRRRDPAGDDPPAPPADSVGLVQDHAVATVPLEVVPRPVDEHDDPVAEADEEHEVQPQPAEPPERAAEADPEGQLGDGGAPADRGHGALVHVAERSGAFAGRPPDDRAGHVATALDRDRCELRIRGALRVGAAGEITDHEDLGVAGHGEVGVHRHLAAAGERQAERGAERIRPHARRPHHRPGRDRGAVREVHGVGGDRRDRGAEADLHAALGQLQLRLGLRRGREAAEHVVGHLDEHDAGASDVEVLEVAREHLGDQLGERAAELHPGGAASGDHERQAAVVHQLRVGVRLLEAPQDGAAQVGRVGDRLERDRVLGDAGHPEVARHRAGGEDQHVVGDRDAAVDEHLAPVEIDTVHRVHPRLHVGGAAARCRAGSARCRPARGRPSPPGRGAARTCGSCAGRRS